MNQEQIKQGVKDLCQTSALVKGYYDDDKNIVEALNVASIEDLEKCAEYYSSRSGVVVDIRKELVNRLLEKERFTVSSLNELIDKFKKGKENKFRSYKETFSIVFPAITFFGHNPQRNFVKSFTNQLINDLGLTNEVKEVSFDFQGVRQQGSNTYWIAIFNKHQENQSKSIQFFFEFYNGKICYGVYKHENQTYIKPRKDLEPEEFSYDEMLSYFQESKEILLGDVPKFDNLLSISLDGHNLYKISHGSFKAKKDEKIIEAFKSNNWIVLHEETKKGQADDFKFKLGIGDYVYITIGAKELVGIAKVISSDWEYVPNDIVENDGWIYREVEMIQPSTRKKIKDLPNKQAFYPSANTTFSEVKSDYLKQANDLLFKPYFNTEFIQNENTKARKNMSRDLNQILFGPPGTGKTYNTINKALELCGEDLNGLGRTEIKHLFEQKVDEGRIVFTTFHQSMTYEDFVEGIKPIEPEKDGDPVVYRVEEGIFRKLCIEASFSLAKEDESVATETVLDFSIAYDNFVQEVEEKLASEEQVEITTKNGGKVVVDGISQQGNIIIKHPGKDNTYPVSKQRLSKLHAAFPDLSSVNNIDQQFRSIIGGSNSTANWSVLNAIRNNNSLPIETKKAVRKYTWDDKKEVVQSLKKEDYNGKKGEPYVLIIDEINRGNVSQIFGELITLIEQDKRLGNAEAIQVQLPYSKEWFGVPPNVHIIGTMNTADRSVEALDTALRRRFSFIEMPPISSLLEPKNMILSLWNSDDFFTVDWDDAAYRKQADELYKLLGISKDIEEQVDDDELEPGFWTEEHLEILADNLFTGFNLKKILDTLNRRIEKLLDKDHMIGHSYFLAVNNINGLKAAFQNKIIPLLQEYFFGDFGKIGLVIGSDFFEITDNQVEDDFFASFDDYDISPLVERRVYHLKNVLNMDDEDFTTAITNLLGRKR